jgi:hypothetical protein
MAMNKEIILQIRNAFDLTLFEALEVCKYAEYLKSKNQDFLKDLKLDKAVSIEGCRKILSHIPQEVIHNILEEG